MRAWLPEQQLSGHEPPSERDVAGLNRVFAEAFTDRYRRDGLVGVRVPHLNPQVWRYALLDAGAGALLWRDDSGQIAAFNIAHRSGTEGWMGPDRKSTRLNSSHSQISYAVFCLKKKNQLRRIAVPPKPRRLHIPSVGRTCPA